MNVYTVTLPVSGKLVVEVQAESEEEAIQIALNAPSTIDDIEEWDVHEHIMEGNCCHAMFWNAEAVDEGPVDEA